MNPPQTSPACSKSNTAFWLGVAASIVVVIVVGIVFILSISRGGAQRVDPLAPSGKVTAQPLPMPDYPDTLVGPQGTAVGDAADDVLELVRRFQQAEQETAKQTGGGAPPPLADQIYEMARKAAREGLPAHTNPPFLASAGLLAAADKARFSGERLFSGVLLEWRAPERLLRALEYSGSAAIIEARLAAVHGNSEQSVEICRAVLIYGHRLTQTHERVWLQSIGCRLQSDAADVLRSVWRQDNPDRARTADALRRSAATSMMRISEVFGQLCNMVNYWHVGDLLLIARDHPDRAWKAEALLAMGMAKHNRSGSMHKAAIEEYLGRTARGPDPWLAAAARWSLALSLEAYRDQVNPGAN